MTATASQASAAEVSKAEMELDLLLTTIQAQLQNNLLTQTVGQLQVRLNCDICWIVSVMLRAFPS
jgi:hypothetical protein